MVGVITGSLAARLLFPEGRGALAAALFWPQIMAGLGLLSLNEAATYSIAAYPDRRPVIKASVVWLSIFFSVIVMCIGYLLIPVLLGDQRADLVSISQVYLLVFIPFNFIGLSLLAGDQGELRFFRYNLLRLMGPVIYLSGLVVFWMTDIVSVASVAILNAVATVIVAITRFAIQRNAAFLQPSLREMVGLTRLAFQFHPASILLMLAAQADQFVVLSLWDNASLGHYMVALTVATSGLAIVSGTFQKVLSPYLSHMADPKDQARLLARSVRHATLLILLLSMPIAIIMPWLIVFLFGKAFSASIVPAWILLGAYLFVGLKTIIIQCLKGMGRGYPGSVAAMISGGLFLAVAWPFGHAFGLIGIGIALGISNSVSVGFLFQYLRRHYGLSLADLWGLSPTAIGEFRTSLVRANPLAIKVTI
jgi:O-antigen/teichoic acid export membrane protein